MKLEPKCLSCKGPRMPRNYLCKTCWAQLPSEAKGALYKRDQLAGARLIELTHQLGEGVPLGLIEVTP